MLRPTASSALIVTLLAGLAPARFARGQCQQWASGFHHSALNGPIEDLAVFDAGSGPELYAAGAFSSAGGASANRVARWDGATWLPLGSGLDGLVSDLAVHDDGSGPALYATGEFLQAGGAPAQRLARWNGTSWSAVGTGLDAPGHALFSFDDGSGQALYVGGQFTVAGGTVAAHVARWNGTSFSAVGGGTDGAVYVFQAFDEGSGPRLFMGGAFFFAGAAYSPNLGRWDGTSWSSVAGGVANGPYPRVEALAVWDDGNGEALHVGGAFQLAGPTPAHNVARWNGTSFAALAAGTSHEVIAFAAWDDGAGDALYAAGYFTSAGAVVARGVARWNGAGWSALAGAQEAQHILALQTFDDGSGPRLHAGGRFFTGPMSPYGVARRSGTAWSNLGSGAGLNGFVYELLPWDGPAGPELIAGGGFSAAGGVASTPVARWNGTSWTSMPGTSSTSFALARFDDGTGGGEQLYTAGFSCAKWNGTGWTAIGNFNPPPGIFALAVYDDPSPAPARLYAGGTFLGTSGITAHRIASYHGGTWTAVGGGISGGYVQALCVFDEGGGPQLFASGDFDFAGGVTTGLVARWNGTSWSAVGGGASGVWSTCMEVFDDGAGAALYVGGGGFSGGGSPATNVLRWDGASWSALPEAPGNTVFDLAVHDDGGGPALQAASTSGVWKWDGAAWNAVGGGSNDWVQALATFDDGLGSALHAGGWFTAIGGTPSAYFGRFGSCTPGVAFCAGDGLDPEVTTPCPCANFGAPGRGCAWAQNPNGARLSGSGTPNPDTLVLTAEGMPGTTLCIFLAGDGVEEGGVVFGDGVRCVGGQLVRMGIAQTNAGVAQYPVGAQLPVSVRGNTPVGSGQVGRYQTYFRTAAPAFCPPESFNVTNGLRLRW